MTYPQPIVAAIMATILLVTATTGFGFCYCYPAVVGMVMVSSEPILAVAATATTIPAVIGSSGFCFLAPSAAGTMADVDAAVTNKAHGSTFLRQAKQAPHGACFPSASSTVKTYVKTKYYFRSKACYLT